MCAEVGTTKYNEDVKIDKERATKIDFFKINTPLSKLSYFYEYHDKLIGGLVVSTNTLKRSNLFPSSDQLIPFNID